MQVPDELLVALELDDWETSQIVANLREQYRVFFIPKRSGGHRQICAPSRKLAHIQRQILRKVLQRIPVNKCAKAYVRGRSILNNARFHQGQKIIVKADISDFFGSINSEFVRKCLVDRGLSVEISDCIAEISSRNGVLLQGAPTSGYLSNIVMDDFDRATILYCIKNGLRYTRYSDDITISGDSVNIKSLYEFLIIQLSKIDLVFNSKKFKVLRNNRHRQLVTGIVVNKEFRPPRSYMRDIRQQMYYARKFGVKHHSEYRGYDFPLDWIRSMLGKVAFARHVTAAETPELDLWQKELLGYRSALTDTEKVA